MLIEPRKLVLPLHQVPKLHKNALLMSFENRWQIQKVFKEIIGLEGIDHFSLNIVDPNDEMSFFSFNPAILYNTVKEGTYLYNGSISSTYYKNYDFYTWEECYDKRFYKTVKDSLQRKNGIETGTCLIYKQAGFHILNTFASKNKSNELVANILENKMKFYRMGMHCFELLKDLYTTYYESPEVYQISLAHFYKNNSHLKLVVDNEQSK